MAGPAITTEWSAGEMTIAERMEFDAGLAGRFVDAEAWEHVLAQVANALTPD
jgi:hypothetical protein